MENKRIWKGGFLNEHGVCPFPTRKSLPDNPYAGTHVIRWANVNFPKDGNYIIEMEVDDDAKVFIGNRSGDGDIGIGNGLISVDDGGDEVILEKKDSNQIVIKEQVRALILDSLRKVSIELEQNLDRKKVEDSLLTWTQVGILNLM